MPGSALQFCAHSHKGRCPTHPQVAPLTEREVALTQRAAADFDLEAYKVDIGVAGVTDSLLHGDSAEAILNARWRYPVLSLHGIEGAFDGEGSKTVIPRRVVGKFSIRIVPHMKPTTVERLVCAPERVPQKRGSQRRVPRRRVP